MDPLPRTTAELLNNFRSNNPTAPRLTWYGPGGERVEFSGKVLDNWVAKTANYLVDELDAEPGTRIALDLPIHWRSFVWLLAAWSVGATAVTSLPGAPESSTPDPLATAAIVATADPVAVNDRVAHVRPAPLVSAVALPALQMRWMGELPPRTLDYSGDVRSHGDVFYADDAPADSDAAWLNAGSTTNYGELAQHAAANAAEAPQRQLLQTQDGWDGVVRAALTTWAAGGSIVLLDSSVEPTDKLRQTENVTAG